MSRENRAFDTERLGAGYGFESYPTQAVELPPTWVLLVGLGFLLLALGFWVSVDSRQRACDQLSNAVIA